MTNFGVFKVGERVWHKEDGAGVVTMGGESIVQVKFDKLPNPVARFGARLRKIGDAKVGLTDQQFKDFVAKSNKLKRRR